MAYFLNTLFFFVLLTFVNAQLYNGWNFGRYYATAPGAVMAAPRPVVVAPAMVAPAVVPAPAMVAAPVPVARPVVAAPAAPFVVPGYAPFASSAILLGSNKGAKN
uniref:Uncharacterized protein n=1 Tax=Strongyloides papillosus TaxID=174720 RepID=A0A0N5B6I2_STREA